MKVTSIAVRTAYIMKHLVSIVALGLSLLVSIPILGISNELEKAQEIAEQKGDKTQLVLSPVQVEYLRIIVVSALVALYVLPLWLVYDLARESQVSPDEVEIKALPPADFTITVEVSASETEDDFTR